MKKQKRTLTGKTIQAIVFLSLILSASAIAFGFYLYSMSVNREFRTKTWLLSQTATEVLDLDAVKAEAERIIEVYDTMTPDEQNENDTEEYYAKYPDIQDEEFEGIRNELHTLWVKITHVQPM